MKIKLIIVTLIFCFLSKDETYSQDIEISYYLGYDCSIEINGVVKSGGCVTDEQMAYTPKKDGKYMASNKLEFKREVRQYNNGEFGKNLEEDSLKIIRFKKKLTSQKFNRLISYLKLVESEFDGKTDATEYIKKEIMSKWDKNTFELNQREIRRIKKKYENENGDLSIDSLIQTISKYIKEENERFLMSSRVEFLDISFEHEKKKYSVWQNNLGGVNVSWQIEIDDKRYSVISPELNKIINPFLAKKMRAKKAINQFLNIKELEGAFKRE